MKAARFRRETATGPEKDYQSSAQIHQEIEIRITDPHTSTRRWNITYKSINQNCQAVIGCSPWKLWFSNNAEKRWTRNDMRHADWRAHDSGEIGKETCSVVQQTITAGGRHGIGIPVHLTTACHQGKLRAVKVSSRVIWRQVSNGQTASRYPIWRLRAVKENCMLLSFPY